LIHLDKLLEYGFNCTIIQADNDEDKKKIREKITFYEGDILFSINFDIEYYLPYYSILNIIDKFSNQIFEFFISNKIINFIKDEILDAKALKADVFEIINYSYCFPFFLYYEPEIIAFSCLNLCLKKIDNKINIIDFLSKLDSISKNEIETCSSLIDKIILSQLNNFDSNTNDKGNNINFKNIFQINQNFGHNTIKEKNEIKK